jgi:hypothetical protein
MTDPMTGLHDQIGTLGVALARWSQRTTPGLSRRSDRQRTRRSMPWTS